MNVRAALKEAMARLRDARVPSHTLAAELLLMHTLGRDRTWLYTYPEAALEPEAAEKYFALVARRAAGEPSQYLTGKQEFWGLEFEVTPAVLIPRPETEHVVEVALDRLGPRGLKVRLDTGAPSAPLRIADAGTGSGCIPVALACELPHAEIFATDISAAALEVARRNAQRHGVADRIHFIQCDLLAALMRSDPHSADSRAAISRSAGAGEAAHSTAEKSPATGCSLPPLDLIVSNPPYVARNEAHTLPREVCEHEPHSALFGGPEGFEIYAHLIGEAERLLCPGGTLVLELGHDSADHVRAILAAQPAWNNVSLTSDLAGIPRVIAAQRT